MKARCLYEPARVLFGRWGRLVPRVSFSSDALGMPREFMGVHKFLCEITLYIVLHRDAGPHVELISRLFLAYRGKITPFSTTYSGRIWRRIFPTISHKISSTDLSTAHVRALFHKSAAMFNKNQGERSKSDSDLANFGSRRPGPAHDFPCRVPRNPVTGATGAIAPAKYTQTGHLPLLSASAGSGRAHPNAPLTPFRPPKGERNQPGWFAS